MEIPTRGSTSPRYGSTLVSQSPSGRLLSGPWDGAFASSPASSGSLRTLYIDSAGLCFEGLANLSLDTSPPSSSNRTSLDASSPRAQRMELARALGITLPHKGSSEPLQARTLNPKAGISKRRNNESVRRSANLNQPRKMN